MFAELGLKTQPCLPALALTDQERNQRSNASPQWSRTAPARPSVFLSAAEEHAANAGRRKTLLTSLPNLIVAARTVIFVGPQERELAAYFEGGLSGGGAVAFEPDYGGALL